MVKLLQLLVAKVLSDQKLDPTIINGGVINSLNSNAKLGKVIGPYLSQMVRWKLFKVTH